MKIEKNMVSGTSARAMRGGPSSFRVEVALKNKM